MPPRSVKRKKSTAASAKAKKFTPKSKIPDDVGSSVADDNTVTGFENEGKESAAPPEDASAAAEVEDGDEAADPITIDKGINQEIEVSVANSVEVVARTVVQVKVEEVIEEVQNVESSMEIRVSTSTENVVEGNGVVEEERETMESEHNGGVNTVNFVVESDPNGGGEVSDDGSGLGIPAVAEKNSVGGETVAVPINNVEALQDKDNLPTVNEGHDGEAEGEECGDGEDDDEDSEEDNVVENKEDEYPSAFCYDPHTERKKEKDIQIFIGKLDKGAVEDDLIQVFGKFGEIKEARIAKNATTNKSKGFAFIRYASIEQARKALSVLKDGVEVRGKHVKIAESQNNGTLFIGNICKSWTNERVWEALGSYGIEHIEELHLPDDPNEEGKIKGYAILEFGTHSDAMVAFHRLRQPDSVFGCDKSAKVAFAQTSTYPTEDVMLQIKTVYLEGLADTWNEEKVREICKKYGETVKIKLSRSLATTRKDFGFITFTSRENALACVEGINNAHIGEGEVKVKACIAKPQWKGQLPRKGFRGGFKVEKKTENPSLRKASESTKQAGPSKMKSPGKSKRVRRKGKAVADEKGKTPSQPIIIKGGKPDEVQTENPSLRKVSASTKQAGPSKMKSPEKSNWVRRKGKAVAEEKGKTPSQPIIIKGGKPNEVQSVNESQFVGTPSKINGKKRNLPLKADGRGKRGAQPRQSERPSKKRRGNTRGMRSKNFREVKREPHVGKGSHYVANPVTYRNIYAPGNAASATNYHNRISGSKRHSTDMEPHAGYLEPVAVKKGRSYVGNPETQGQSRASYLEPAIRTQGRPHTGYLQSAAGTQGQPHVVYLQPTVGTQIRAHSGYLRPSAGTQVQPHPGYLEPGVGTQGRSYTGYSEYTVQTQGQSQGGYREPALVTQSQPHARYYEPAAEKHGHDPYDHGLRRAAGQHGQSSGSYAYVEGSARLPSYPSNYTSYAGYEGTGGTSGGHYQSSGTYYLPPRTYY